MLQGPANIKRLSAVPEKESKSVAYLPNKETEKIKRSDCWKKLLGPKEGSSFGRSCLDRDSAMAAKEDLGRGVQDLIVQSFCYQNDMTPLGGNGNVFEFMFSPHSFDFSMLRCSFHP